MSNLVYLVPLCLSSAHSGLVYKFWLLVCLIIVWLAEDGGHDGRIEGMAFIV